MTSAASSASATHAVPIDLGDRSYDIQIGTSLIGRDATWAGLPNAATALIVTNETVAPLYADVLKNGLARKHARVLQINLPDGEAFKDWATLNRIFDPFFTTKGPGEGTGLGLSIVRHVATNHGGKVSVTSVEGEGSTFRLQIPTVGAAARDLGERAAVGRSAHPHRPCARQPSG